MKSTLQRLHEKKNLNFRDKVGEFKFRLDKRNHKRRDKARETWN